MSLISFQQQIINAAFDGDVFQKRYRAGATIGKVKAFKARWIKAAIKQGYSEDEARQIVNDAYDMAKLEKNFNE